MRPSAVRMSAQRWPLAVLGAAVVILAACGSAPASPSAAPARPTDDRDAMLSALAFFPLADPEPVLGADDHIHLAYELIAMNQSGSAVTIQDIEVLDVASGQVLDTVEGAALQVMTRLSDGAGPAFGPGGSGYVFMDVSLAAGAAPRGLTHRITMSLAQPGAAPTTSTITGVPVGVGSRAAVVVAPPLRGEGWLVGSGCCDAITSHRGATLSIDGTAHAPERFAIDFVQLDPQGQLYSGDPALTGSFPFFGAEVYSVARGTVVAVVDGLPENVPGRLPADATVQTAGGNHVVVDIGDGRFAFYAHLQPGSVRVKTGAAVDTGTVLGLLGNTGNSDAPHLHFHVMDGPSPLQSNGLPFRFTGFEGQGRVTDESALATPFPPIAPVVAIDRTTLAGRHVEQLPLNLQIVRFE
jgi:Peptidase family M23